MSRLKTSLLVSEGVRPRTENFLTLILCFVVVVAVVVIPCWKLSAFNVTRPPGCLLRQFASMPTSLFMMLEFQCLISFYNVTSCCSLPQRVSPSSDLLLPCYEL